MQDSGFQVLLQGNNFLRILQGLGVTRNPFWDCHDFEV